MSSDAKRYARRERLVVPLEMGNNYSKGKFLLMVLFLKLSSTVNITEDKHLCYSERLLILQPRGLIHRKKFPLQ